MPRRAEYQRRRALGLCVECSNRTDNARCHVCKAKARTRDRRYGYKSVSYRGITDFKGYDA